MIRLFIAASMIMMAGVANSASNETIYMDCKKYADSNFDLNGFSGAACVAYFAGVKDALKELCFEYEMGKSEFTEGEKSVFEFFGVGSGISMNAAIQDYVNTMQTRPEDWGKVAGRDVRKSLQKMSNCRPE